MLCNTKILLDTTLLKVDVFMKKLILSKDTKAVRTLIVPNQAIATYVTQWTYDSTTDSWR